MTEPAAAEESLAALLAQIEPYREKIEHHVAERDRLLIERAELFRAIREADPELPLSKLAERAGISVPAVIQQINKAKSRLSEAAAG